MHRLFTQSSLSHVIRKKGDEIFFCLVRNCMELQKMGGQLETLQSAQLQTVEEVAASGEEQDVTQIACFDNTGRPRFWRPRPDKFATHSFTNQSFYLISFPVALIDNYAS